VVIKRFIKSARQHDSPESGDQQNPILVKRFVRFPPNSRGNMHSVAAGGA
jgi:hypothetical protein